MAVAAVALALLVLGAVLTAGLAGGLLTGISSPL